MCRTVRSQGRGAVNGARGARLRGGVVPTGGE